LASRSNLLVIPLLLLAPTAAPAEPQGAIAGSVEIAKVSVGSRVSGFGDVVVYLEDAPAQELATDKPFEIVQRDKTFTPSFLIVPKGATVAFPNRDKLAHNVFSPAAGASFDLGIYKPDSTKTVTFDKPGLVPIFCNIHPQMIAHVLVVANRYYARPDGEGKFALAGVPPGKYHAVAWFPYGNPERAEVTVEAGRRAKLAFTLRERKGATDHRTKTDQPYTRY